MGEHWFHVLELTGVSEIKNLIRHFFPGALCIMWAEIKSPFFWFLASIMAFYWQ